MSGSLRGRRRGDQGRGAHGRGRERPWTPRSIGLILLIVTLLPMLLSLAPIKGWTHERLRGSSGVAEGVRSADESACHTGARAES